VLAFLAANGVKRGYFLLDVLAAASGTLDFFIVLLKCKNQLEGFMTIVADVVVNGHADLPLEIADELR
jgi:hypothetical protein